MIYASDSAESGIDKIIDILETSEIQNKDLVIPKDKLYIYRNILEKAQRKFVRKRKVRTNSNDCAFSNSRVG